MAGAATADSDRALTSLGTLSALDADTAVALIGHHDAGATANTLSPSSHLPTLSGAEVAVAVDQSDPRKVESTSDGSKEITVVPGYSPFAVGVRV